MNQFKKSVERDLGRHAATPALAKELLFKTCVRMALVKDGIHRVANNL